MRRYTDEEAPTVEVSRPRAGRARIEPPRRQRSLSETPLGGVELAALTARGSAAWDAQTFAMRMPVEEAPSRLFAMSVAALLSFVIGLATFLVVMRIQSHPAANAQTAAPEMSLGATPLVEEGIPIPSPGYEATPVPTGLGMQFVPTEDVVSPPDPRGVDVQQQAASPIVLGTSPSKANHADPRAAAAPTGRKVKKTH